MKKLKDCKGFILGVVFSMILFSFASPAFAASLTKSAQLVYKNIKITLNGQTVTPRDVDGNVVEPFIIDGTTYLPVRAICNALIIGVKWDESTNTVMLYGDTAPIPSPPPSAEPFDTLLQSRLVVRVDTCLRNAGYQSDMLQNKWNDALSRGMARGSYGDAIRADMNAVSTDISSLQSIKSGIRSALTNDELAQYAESLVLFEQVY